MNYKGYFFIAEVNGCWKNCLLYYSSFDLIKDQIQEFEQHLWESINYH